MTSGNILYPSITSLPGSSGVHPGERTPAKKEGVKGEFDHVLEKTLGTGAAAPDLGQLSHSREPLKFSAHASQRLKDRKIDLSPAEMAKVSDAIDKARAKGVDDALVLTKDAVLIVSAKNKTVITALDKGSLSGNVFTNIDGAVII